MYPKDSAQNNVISGPNPIRVTLWFKWNFCAITIDSSDVTSQNSINFHTFPPSSANLLQSTDGFARYLSEEEWGGLIVTVSLNNHGVASANLPITHYSISNINTVPIVQGDYAGFNTGNGEKLSYSQAACLAWLCLAVTLYV